VNTAKSLHFLDFNSPDNPLVLLKKQLQSHQTEYLYKYLKNLGASKIIIEPNYFDRDYLSEVSAFYCLSAKGYPNVCQRLHFFSNEQVTRDNFAAAVGGGIDEIALLQDNYLGFIVIRPISNSPFGRTVVAWYPDQTPDIPRVTESSRKYTCHLAGIELEVVGLAWQQQDTGVAACATIGIWSMLHSSAFDAQHSIPTTSMITEAAHSSALVGHRTFPSYSLTYDQIQHAITQLGFSPAKSNGDLFGQFFSKEKFSNTCAAYLRSGYPLIIGGFHHDGAAVGHAICAVGFREASPRADVDAGSVLLQDDNIEFLYIHDDNIGPNVRFKIESEACEIRPGQIIERCIMKMETPGYLTGNGEPDLDRTSFIPMSVIAAVHNDLKISSDIFFQHGIQLSQQICSALNMFIKSTGAEERGYVFSSRFIMLKDYIGTELSRQLSAQNLLLSNVRMQLQESVPPMSLHLALLRIALPDGSLLLDVLFDTTDTDRNRSVFCHIVYDQTLSQLFELLKAQNIDMSHSIGICVRAFE
jgi:hypothetical protein